MSENPEIKKILIILLFFASVLSSFYVLDFKVSHRETPANSAVGAYASSDPKLSFSGKCQQG
jgi:hypothetical protein